MTAGTAQKFSNAILSCAAGTASFLFSLAALLYLTEFDEKMLAALVAGAFCLLVSYIAAERPNSENARALSALSERLLAVEDGDLVSPAPAAVQRVMPKVAAAVDSLFAEVRASIENAHALGMYDPVTSLPNRLHFRSEADKLMSEVLEDAQSAMLFVDLDRFKIVNDSLGHARGDQLLIMVANRLRVVVNAEFTGSARDAPAARAPRRRRVHDLLPRDRVGRRARADRAADRACHLGAVRAVLAQRRHRRFHRHRHLSRSRHSIEALMRAADIAMYRAKESGGGQHCLFDSDLAAEHQQKVETEKALSESVLRDEFVLAFQPQMSLVTGEIAGAEALLRWKHPRDGLRLPGTFIPVAERTGLIADIGDWVIGEVASTLAQWHGDGFDGRLGFNISPRQVDRPDFFVKLRQAFIDADVPLSLIELEFTESAAMEVGASVLEEIGALRNDGARITIDDFGTGYSNLARLRAMPLDRVKLDPSLIADIEVNEKARVIVQAVIHLIKGVECEIVAEAVETVAQADMLRAMGCDTVQGYVFAPPMMEEEFLAWTSKGSTADVKSVA